MHVTPVPFFFDDNVDVDPQLCFVLMPFNEPWSDRTHHVLKSVVEGLGYSCRRADDYYGKVVLHDIWNSLNRAAFVIADLTGANPNVYYELGIAHVLGKEIIPLLQTGYSLPFDQQPFRILFYEDNVDGAALLRERLPEWISDFTFESSPEMMLRRGLVTQFNAWRAGRQHVHFTRRVLARIVVPEVDFSGVYLSETDLSEANLRRGHFRDGILIRTDLSGAQLDDSDLMLANLSESRLEGTSLRRCDLRHSVLIRARLDGADLRDANVENATIDRATLEAHREVVEMARNAQSLIIESG